MAARAGRPVWLPQHVASSLLPLPPGGALVATSSLATGRLPVTCRPHATNTHDGFQILPAGIGLLPLRQTTSTSTATSTATATATATTTKKEKYIYFFRNK